MSAHPVVTDSPSPEPPRSPRIPLILRLGLSLAVLLLCIGVYLRFFAPRTPPTALPVMGHMPELALVDQAGAPFTDAALRGKVWVADFIFTSCSESCPRLTKKMKRLQDIVAARQQKRGGPSGVRLVSFSVDPETDTPPVLAAYAAKVPADPTYWSFVTGPSDKVRAAVVDGFKMTAEKTKNAAGGNDVLHGNWFVLGDRSGDIRGYYEAKTDEDVDAIARDVERLEAEPAR